MKENFAFSSCLSERARYPALTMYFTKSEQYPCSVCPFPHKVLFFFSESLETDYYSFSKAELPSHPSLRCIFPTLPIDIYSLHKIFDSEHIPLTEPILNVFQIDQFSLWGDFL